VCVVELTCKSIFALITIQIDYTMPTAKEIIDANVEKAGYKRQIAFKPENLGPTLQQQRQKLTGLHSGGENTLLFLDAKNRKALKGMTKVEPKQKLDSPAGTLEEQRKNHLDLSSGGENDSDTLRYVNEKHLGKQRQITGTNIGL
jgi:hypothetical protein